MFTLKKKQRLSGQSGQSLIEVAIAATALVFVLVAIVSGLMLSVRNSTYSNNQAVATKHTQEGIELFRRFNNELGWESFHSIINNDGTNFTYCLNDIHQITDVDDFRSLNTGTCGSSEVIDGTLFRREAEVSVINDDEIAFTINVHWQDGEEVRTTTLQQSLRRRQ
jgi:Tfp pilus assembly protein PilV